MWLPNTNYSSLARNRSFFQHKILNYINISLSHMIVKEITKYIREIKLVSPGVWRGYFPAKTNQRKQVHEIAWYQWRWQLPLGERPEARGQSHCRCSLRQTLSFHSNTCTSVSNNYFVNLQQVIKREVGVIVCAPRNDTPPRKTPHTAWLLVRCCLLLSYCEPNKHLITAESYIIPNKLLD